MKSLESSGSVSAAEGHDGILTIRGGGQSRAWNGIKYKAGLSGKNVGAQHLSMNVATIPPGGVAYAHIHVGFEVMLYILEGRVRQEWRTSCPLSDPLMAFDERLAQRIRGPLFGRPV